MDTEKIKSMMDTLKKYTPLRLSPKAMGRAMAYQIGYTQGYLIKTGKIKEIKAFLKKED